MNLNYEQIEAETWVLINKINGSKKKEINVKYPICTDNESLLISINNAVNF